jgi:hypothetical protein
MPIDAPTIKDSTKKYEDYKRFAPFYHGIPQNIDIFRRANEAADKAQKAAQAAIQRNAQMIETNREMTTKLDQVKDRPQK